MIVLLKDFSGDVQDVEIPDDTQVIVGINISGDMVMIYPVFFDSDTNFRFDDFLEESWSIERKDFDTIKDGTGKLDLSKLIKEE